MLAALVLLAALPAFGQAAVSEAKGKVQDSEGKPVAGATITFTLSVPPGTSYAEKSDRKGNYYFPNLLYHPPGIWKVQIQAEGFNVAKVKVTSRTGDKTLLGDPFETKLRSGGPPVEVKISGLGEATVDFVLSHEEAATQAATAAAAAEDPWDQARGRVQSGDLEGSVDFFKKAIEARPDDAERRQLFAYALWKLDRMGEAEAQALKARQIAPDRPGTNLILAEIYKSNGDNDRAWTALQKERELAPDKVHVLALYASLATELGRADDAIGADEAITRIQPDNAEAWVALGSLYAQKGEHDKSEQAFRKVVELDPAKAYQTFYNIGVVIANKPDLGEAENRKAMEAFRKAVELKSDYAAAHRELAFALLRANDRAGALTELEQYLKLDPSAADAADVRATIKSLRKK